ncbi:MAG: nucleotidyltransferase domain-containing protein [Nitrososphaeria archaeon]
MYRKGIEHIMEPYRSLMEDLLNALILVFKDNLVSVIIYGSVARGQTRKDSDLDLFIVVDDLPASRFERNAMFYEAEKVVEKRLDELFNKGYAISLSPILRTSNEAMKIVPLYLDMVDDCIILYDKKGFFEKILERLLLKLNELGAERVWIGKKWYWRLKKDYKFGEVIVIE